ncbi:MAG: transcription elongation factor GreA [Pseudonocardiales bacterium]|jgi:transcription elongation factor GreA|nr:transcription elongation factor GreA [Pseudonocardiales bacterium]MDT4919378.1 transcription elongation factor GreA [Pseudonocardiales bacterium]
MTTTLTTDTRTAARSSRLADLYVERNQLLAEIAPVGSGDDADRATNVDGHIRLAMLEQRIVALESELAEPPARHQRAADGTVTVGDVVTVDLGDGPETYLLGSVDEAADGVDVITPASPLGKVLQGAPIGATLSYAARPGRSLKAKVIAVA